MRGLTCSSHTISGVLPGGLTVSRHSFESRVVAMAKAGYQGMYLHFRDYARERQSGRSDADINRILRTNGIEPVGVEFLNDWFLGGEASRSAKECEDTAFAAAQACGARIVNVGPDLHGHGISPARMRERFEALCRRAERHGISIALEIVAWGNVRDVTTALQLIDGIPNAGLVIDSWHVFRAGISFDDLMRIPAERILCIQVNDAAPEAMGPLAEDTLCRRLCGYGAFDLSGFKSAITMTGVTIPFCVEIISREQAERSLNDAAMLSFSTAWKSLTPGGAARS